MSVLGLATNVGGRVADVEVSAPRVPAQSIHSDDEVSFNWLIRRQMFGFIKILTLICIIIFVWCDLMVLGGSHLAI